MSPAHTIQEPGAGHGSAAKVAEEDLSDWQHVQTIPSSSNVAKPPALEMPDEHPAWAERTLLPRVANPSLVHLVFRHPRAEKWRLGRNSVTPNRAGRLWCGCGKHPSEGAARPVAAVTKHLRLEDL